MLIRLYFAAICGFFLLIFTADALSQASWDWHIKGAKIVDGTGKATFRADVLIRGDTIDYIGEVNADTIDVKNREDASGKLLTPGFIDSHAHGDPLEHADFDNFLAMGVTSIVLGQDGSSSAVGSLKDWFEEIEDADPGPNIATMSGHGSLRRSLDIGRQEPTAAELEKMEQLLKSDLKDGAFGMSTGLEYVPGMYADGVELKRLAEIIGEYDALIMSHMRSEDDNDMEASLDELAAQGKYADVHASHLKVVYGQGADRAEEILEHIRQYEQQGISFTADLYPYAASFTGIGIVFPEWAKTESEWRSAMEERPEVLRRYLKDKVEQRNGPDAILFGSGEFAGMTLLEASKREKKSPIDLLLEMGPEAASAAHFVMNEQLQDRLVTGEMVMISSDGSPTMHHPRGYGSFPKIISRYVIDQQTLTIEEAVFKMSGMPADRMGFENRGKIREGAKADLLLFDPEKVQDTATFEDPHKLAEGFDWIMINGELVREEGVFSGNRNGKVLKRQ